MMCPVCKLDMMVVEYHDIELDYCMSCKGVWFDAGEVELLLESHGLKETGVFLDRLVLSPEAETTEKKRKCPICRRGMKKTTIGKTPQTLIDICRDGHGLWFDGGEVLHLVRHIAGEHPAGQDSAEQIVGFLEEVFEAPARKGNNEG